MQIQLDVIFGVMVIITSLSHYWLFLPFAVLQGEKKIIPTKYQVQLLLQCCFGATASTTTLMRQNSSIRRTRLIYSEKSC